MFVDYKVFGSYYFYYFIVIKIERFKKKFVITTVMSDPVPFSLEEQMFIPVQIGNQSQHLYLSLHLLEPKTLEGHVKHAQEAVRGGNFRAASAPEVYAMGEALYDRRDAPEHKGSIERVRDFLGGVLKRNWIGTLSRVDYASEGKDRVVHNVGLLSEYGVDADIVGSDGWLKDLQGSDGLCGALLGSSDAEKVRAVSQWITGRDVHAWRLNNRLYRKESRPVSLGNGYISSGFNIIAIDNINSSRLALGVRIVD